MKRAADGGGWAGIGIVAAWLAVSLTALAATAASGQTAQPPAPAGQSAQPTAAASQPTQPAAAGVPYADAAFGFEMMLPAGWSYDRSRFQELKDSIGLLRGRSPDGHQVLQIMVFRSFPMPPFEDWIVDFGKRLAEMTQSPRVDWETWQLPPRAGALLSYTNKVGGAKMRSFCLCLPFDPNTVWVLVCGGEIASDADVPARRATFDALVSTLRIHYDPATAEQLAAGFERAKPLRSEVRRLGEKLASQGEDQWFDLSVAGKPIGYLRRRISREEYVFSRPQSQSRFSKQGVRVRERAWRFADDGTVRYTRLDLFSSLDGLSELIENQQTQIPAPDVQPQTPLVKRDQVVREDEVLFSSYVTSLDNGLPDPAKPTSVGPAYLDLAWTRLVPGLLIGQPAETYAFATYSTETRSLLSYQVKPLGERALPDSPGKAYAFEVREGLIDAPSVVYVDAAGNMLRVEAGDLVVQRAAREQIAERYGAREAEARKRGGILEE